jgi:C4-dicarboxylate transporter, DctQ subunit
VIPILSRARTGWLRVVDRATRGVLAALLALAALQIFLLSFLVVADVIGRAAFNHPVRGTPEMVAMSIVIICFLIAAYAVHSGAMLQADLLVNALGPRGQVLSMFLSGILGAAFFGLIAWGSWEPTLHAWSSSEFEGEGSLRIPVWPARLVVMLGAVLVTLVYAGQAICAVLGFSESRSGQPRGGEGYI